MRLSWPDDRFLGRKRGLVRQPRKLPIHDPYARARIVLTTAVNPGEAARIGERAYCSWLAFAGNARETIALQFPVEPV
jgi:hypothetical protein